jgi:hypothetical protein
MPLSLVINNIIFYITCELGVLVSTVPLYTMMVFDEWHNGVLVPYIITSSYKTCDLSPWMDALKKNLFLV